MIIPHQSLAPDTLTALIEEYVTRDGTELTDAPPKIDAVRQALRHGELVLVFDPDSGSCNLVPPDGLPDPSAA